MNADNSTPVPGSDAWLNQVQEDIIDPARRIVDPHHHLWRKRFNRDYLLQDLWADTGSGHRIEQTVFVECRAFYDKDAPEHLQSLGETRVISEIAAQSRAAQAAANNKSEITGIVAKVDLRLGEQPDRLREVIGQHAAIAGPLLKGIRHSGAHDARTEDLSIPGTAPAYLYGKESFRQGLRILGELGLTFDTWHYHHQNEDFILARRWAWVFTGVHVMPFSRNGNRTFNACHVARTFMQNWVDWRCRTMALAGIVANARQTQMNWCDGRNSTTCTLLNVLALNAVCSKAISQWTGCPSVTLCYGMRSKKWSVISAKVKRTRCSIKPLLASTGLRLPPPDAFDNSAAGHHGIAVNF